eukprot:gene2074-13034_t
MLGENTPPFCHSSSGVAYRSGTLTFEIEAASECAKSHIRNRSSSSSARQDGLTADQYDSVRARRSETV